MTCRPHPRRLLLASLLLAAVAPAWAAFDVDQLMRLLARQPGGEARFSETRQVQGLERPLQSSGLLRFSPPDRFERETLEPRAESMRVEGNTLVLSRGGRSRTMTLDAAPEAAALVEAIRGTLTGDKAALERLFGLNLQGPSSGWTLTLSPREGDLQRQVSSVQIGGRDGEVRRIDVYLTGGDRSTMEIEPLARGGATGAPTGASAAPSGPGSAKPAARP